MTSRFSKNAVAEYVLLNEGVEYNDIVLRRTLANSKMLSSDVSAGFDPMYEDVYEKRKCSIPGTRNRCLTNIQDPAERADPMTRIRNILHSSDRLWKKQV